MPSRRAWTSTGDGLEQVPRGMRDLIDRGVEPRQAGVVINRACAPVAIKAVEQLWPRSDRQHCTVHRLRNLLAKLPKQDRERVRLAYWHALDEATSQADGTRGYKC